MANNYLTRETVSHTRKVCSLYKRMFRDIQYQEQCFFEFRFKQLELRRKFDDMKNIKDMRQAKAIYEAAKEKFEKHDIDLYHAHGQPWHPYSKEGIAYNRNEASPDTVLDQWNPIEKARYPYYFAKREAMKDEYIRMWHKKVLKTPLEEDKPTEETKSSK